jgi:RNA polymerase sigma-70 factor (ECF subfamily)
MYLNKEKYLEMMIEKYSNMVYRLALTRTNTKENSEDVYQEVFLRLSRKMPQFENEEHEKAWLIRVTINCSKSLLNSSFLKNTTEINEDIVFETKERHDIYYAVQELPIKYRTIIYLFYYEGYKINEISKILKINENTIKARLSRARNKLKQIIEGGIEE